MRCSSQLFPYNGGLRANLCYKTLLVKKLVIKNQLSNIILFQLLLGQSMSNLFLIYTHGL